MSAWLILTHAIALVAGMVLMDHLDARIKRLESDPDSEPHGSL